MILTSKNDLENPKISTLSVLRFELASLNMEAETQFLDGFY